MNVRETGYSGPTVHTTTDGKPPPKHDATVKSHSVPLGSNEDSPWEPEKGLPTFLSLSLNSPTQLAGPTGQVVTSTFSE